MGSLHEVEEADLGDELQPPTMSFESYFYYDRPRRKKKKKKTMKTSATAFREKKRLQND